MAKIAFIGLGNMGGPMASNLLKHGHDVVVFDLVQSALDQKVKEGARAAASAADAVSSAEVVISMLPAAHHVEALYTQENGIINAAATGTLFIDSSTIDADTAKRVGESVNSAGSTFIDAPVSGGVAGAAAGTLTFIMGGDAPTVKRAKPILSCMGQNLFHAGEIGAGQIAKICNNMLLAVLMSGTSEALSLAIDNGIDPKIMSDIMRQSSGCNWTLQKYNPCPDVMENVPAQNNYDGGFMVKLMNKDLNLAMETAKGTTSPTPIAAAAQALYRLHEQAGYGDKDFSSVFKMFAK